MSKMQTLWNSVFIKPGNVWNQIICKILIFSTLKVKCACGKGEKKNLFWIGRDLLNIGSFENCQRVFVLADEISTKTTFLALGVTFILGIHHSKSEQCKTERSCWSASATSCRALTILDY